MSKRFMQGVKEHPSVLGLAANLVLAVSVPILVLCLLADALAYMGVFGDAVKAVVTDAGVSRWALFTALVPFILSVLGCVATAFICGSILTYRQDLLNRAADETSEGKEVTESEALMPGDDTVLKHISDCNDRISRLNSRNEELESSCSTLSEDSDRLMFNLLTAKASPATMRYILRGLEGLAERGEVGKIKTVLRSLNYILDSVLADSSQMVSLSNELSLIRSRLAIDEVLTGVPTAFRLSVMCRIVDYNIIPCVILPVVTSFLESTDRGMSSDNYEVCVEVGANPNNLVIVLRDNGTGIPDAKLRQIRAELDAEDFDINSESISLANINRRIKLHYGDQYGLKLSNSKLGTVVRLYLPPLPDPLESFS